MAIFYHSRRSELEVRTRFYLALFISLTLFFFGPAHLYFYNILEYDFSYQELFLYLFISSIFFTAIAFILITVLSRITSAEKTASVFLGIAILLWFQGNLLVWDYGQLDGTKIDWKEKTYLGLIDSSIWFVLLSVFYLKAAFFRKSVHKVALFFLLIQLLSLSIIFFQTSSPGLLKYAEDQKEKFLFSKNKNIIVIILDTLQTDIVQEIILEDNYYRDLFQGFTYFPNSVSGYPSTYPSIPLILTGKYYDNSIPIQNFIKNNFSSDSVPKLLKDNAFHVYIDRAGEFIPYDPNIASNFRKRKLLGDITVGELSSLMDTTLFRYSPHFVKKVFFNKILNNLVSSGSDTGEHRDLKYFKKMPEDMKLTDKNVFKFYHLWGVHLPFRLNEDLQYEEMETNRPSLKRQAKASLKITGQFLDNLKKLGVWDQSIIFILADHGLGTPESPSATANNNMAYLNPLILVKPIASIGSLKTSNAPVMLADVSKTIFSSIGIKADFLGKNMFELDDSSVRKRRYLSFDWQRFGNWKDDFLPPMREYFVTGNSWLIDSWQETPNVFLPKEKFLLDKYTYGAKIGFGSEGDSLKYEKHGWTRAAKNKNVSFSIGSSASLVLFVTSPKYDLVLRCKILPYLAKGKLKKQTIRIKINGFHAGEWILSGPGEYSVQIPKKHIQGSNTINVTFEMPHAKSPLDMGLGSDTRPLSFMMEWLSLSLVK